MGHEIHSGIPFRRVLKASERVSLQNLGGNCGRFKQIAPEGFKTLFVKDAFLEQLFSAFKAGASPPAGPGLDAA